jgi:hypothetical protein
MYSRYYKARAKAFLDKITSGIKKTDDIVIEIPIASNNASKKVYAYAGRKLVGEYDSITLCASTLGMTRAMIKKAIESGVELENGFKLTLNKK